MFYLSADEVHAWTHTISALQSKIVLKCMIVVLEAYCDRVNRIWSSNELGQAKSIGREQEIELINHDRAPVLYYQSFIWNGNRS